MDNLTLKQIILDQRDELAVLFKKDIIERRLVSFHESDMRTDLLKVITGVRRCGKSVYAHLILRGLKYAYINFDDERLMGLEAADLNDVYQVLREITPDAAALIFDEIQNVSGWELFINRLKRKGLQIVITGSNSNLLSQELSTHLTGRYLPYELFPFSFREYLDFFGKPASPDQGISTDQKADLLSMLDGYIQRGGFPETFVLESPYGYLRELYDKLITRDIVLRYALQNVKALKDIALYLVSNFGNRFSYNRLRNMFDIKSVHTAQNYTEYLERVYLVFQLPAFSHKVSQHARHPRKIYCVDSGMINALAPRLTIDLGRMIENLVFLEMKRRGREIFFYPMPSGEVDFVVRDQNRVRQLVQVCLSVDNPETLKRELKSLCKASAELSCSNLVVLTWDTERDVLNAGTSIRLIPLWKWLLEKSDD